MLKILKIINFKTHKRTILDLHPNLNAVIGLPNRGKSNIRKALQWMAFNTHPFKRVHSKFTTAPYTKVQTVLDNDDVISLKKNSTESFYHINDEKPYRKFGTSVPDRISQKLNFSSINFTDQHDSPFLITASPPEIARTINRITNVESIDQCIQNINKGIYALKQKSSALASAQAVSVAKLKRLTRLDEAKKYIESAKGINQKINKNIEYIDHIESVQYEIGNIKKILQNKDQLHIAEDYISQAEKIRKQLESNYAILNICESIVNLGKIIKIAKREKIQYVNEFIKELRIQKRCPTCLGKITSEHIHSIKEELT